MVYDFSPTLVQEFNGWCDAEYVLALRNVEGLFDCQHWRARDHPQLALMACDVRDPGMLNRAIY